MGAIKKIRDFLHCWRKASEARIDAYRAAMPATTMAIQFKFDPDKALGSMAYLISRLGGTDKVKLMKLLYIADRNHFIRHGHPITGSRQSAMPFGPVPSECLSLLDGIYFPLMGSVYEYLHVDNCEVTLGNKARIELDATEKETLDNVVKSYGDAPKWELVDYTHKFEEYKKAREGPGNAPPISYELLLETYSSHNESRFRHGRPVLTAAMTSRMICPFKSSETDL